MTADELFEKGIALLNDNTPLAALAFFEKAYTAKKTPSIQSYLGMCIALERGKITYGFMLCNEAILQEPENPVHYLNLGRIYQKAGKRVDAIETFRKGLSFGDNQEIKRILDKLGTRKKPLLPFLPRNNFLNKYTGLMMHRLKLR
ncbi:MAG: tetratricopeptide repeat protein [Thermodesulfovibrionales bacterium]|nr:tetratricopeptide repeat protein [Thermodesulfovibrionales bacterium]